MRQDLINKVKVDKIYDTLMYRYVYDQETGEIRRIRREYLDTVKAQDPEEWEVIR